MKPESVALELQAPDPAKSKFTVGGEPGLFLVVGVPLLGLCMVFQDP